MVSASENQVASPTCPGHTPGSWAFTVIAIFYLQNVPSGPLVTPLPGLQVLDRPYDVPGLWRGFLEFLAGHITQVTVSLDTPCPFAHLTPRPGLPSSTLPRQSSA